MGFYLKSDAAGQESMAGEFRGSPKTHTPVSPVQDLGLRYYSANLSRWISRDPAGEADGPNCMTFGANNAIGRVDQFGMDSM